MNLPYYCSVFLVANLAIASSAFEPPANSDLVVDEPFEGSELGKGWTTQTGNWNVLDGTLRGSEITAENHAAAARRVVETEDAVYQLKFRLGEGAKGFHFGFDPKRGELDKRGHLFSVIMTRSGWRILKHLDKNKPEEDPNEILASANHEFAPNQWYSLRIVTWGPTVKARIEGIPPLEAAHPSFAVKKPTLVFRVSGDGVEIDDIKVWKPQL